MVPAKVPFVTTHIFDVLPTATLAVRPLCPTPSTAAAVLPGSLLVSESIRIAGTSKPGVAFRRVGRVTDNDTVRTGNPRAVRGSRYPTPIRNGEDRCYDWVPEKVSDVSPALGSDRAVSFAPSIW